MDLDVELPFKVCLNPLRREDRRRSVSEMFRMHKLKVTRWPWLEASDSKHLRGFRSLGLRANYLSFMLALRKARAGREKALLFFEDDVILHDAFREKVAALHVPEDWGMLYFGCLHIERPKLISPNLLKVSRAFDIQAIAVHGRCFTEVLHQLRPVTAAGRGINPRPLDVALADLHGRIPTYAAWPNLAWQSEGYSNLAGRVYSNYGPDGSQRFMPEVVSGL